MSKRKNLFNEDPTIRNTGQGNLLSWNEWQDAKYGIGDNPMFGGTGYGAFNKSSKSTKGKDDTWTSVGKCAHSHPPLLIPGTEFTVFGGACGSPQHKADIYIGLDERSMRFSPRSWPWKKGEEFVFPIQDYGVPHEPEEFKKLIRWSAKQVNAGLKLHCGCIGGHGRTGMFLAALVTEMSGEKDSVSYVRKHYCKKAVENEKQVNFLHEHFGITKVAGSKKWETKKDAPWESSGKPAGTAVLKKLKDHPGLAGTDPGNHIYSPVESTKCIW